MNKSLVKGEKRNVDFENDLKKRRQIAEKYYASASVIMNRRNQGLVVTDEKYMDLFMNKIAINIAKINSVKSIPFESRPFIFDGKKDITKSLYNYAYQHPNTKVPFPLMSSLKLSDGRIVNAVGWVEYVSDREKGVNFVFEFVFSKIKDVMQDDLFHRTIADAMVFPFIYNRTSRLVRFSFDVPSFLKDVCTNYYITSDEAIKFFKFSDREKIVNYLTRCIEEDDLDKLYSSVWFIKDSKGKEIWYEIRINLIKDLENESKRLVIGSFVQMDKAYSKLKIMASRETKAMQAVRLQQKFLAKMSHDIRTPLNTILGFSELIADEKLSIEERKNYQVVMKDNGHNLLKLIDDILDLSKIEAGTLKINCIMVSVPEFFRESEILMEKEPANDGVKVTFHYSYDSMYSYFDTNRFMQILTYLLSNAKKYTDRGTIDVFLTLKDNEVTIKVVDTGRGISEEKQKYIFKPFTGLYDFTHGDDLGLGLSIVSKIIEILNGSYGFNSIYKEGSTFWVKFPIEQEQEELLLIDSDEDIKKFLSEDAVNTKRELL